MSLTEEEQAFVKWWEEHRKRKKRTIWQLAAGLPLGVTLATAIFVNFFWGWHTRATMQFNVNSSSALVLLLALLGIVIFVVVFSARHKWEMNEQRYKELLHKSQVP
jgi:hypothetical protein